MKHETGNEQDILKQAIQAVERETGLVLRLQQRELRRGEQWIDAALQLEPGNHIYMAEVKRWAQQANLGALMHQIQQLPETGLLVADYINPKMAARLRQQGVQFIDTLGNAYINQPPVYVYVTGMRESGFQARGTVVRGETRRAFEPTGLKVIYAFLCDPHLVNAPYRVIAEKAGVALGTVGWVINGLKAAGLVTVKGKKRERQITHYRKLLDRWVEAWPEKLKPKQLVGEFIADDPYWWQGINIEKFEGYWGGEVAGAKYTDYLKPKVATLYLPEGKRAQLLGKARLRKATEWSAEEAGTVLIYQPFWPEKFAALYTKKEKGVVHPILVYADLIATGDPRNMEVAGRLYDEQIAGYNGED